MEDAGNCSIKIQWFGHVRRMDEKRWPNILLQWSPAGRRKRGRPRAPWRSGISRMMDERELEEGDWNDRLRCKMGIKSNHLKVERPSKVKVGKKNPSTSAGFESANLGSSDEYHNHGTTGVAFEFSIIKGIRFSMMERV